MLSNVGQTPYLRNRFPHPLGPASEFGQRQPDIFGAKIDRETGVFGIWMRFRSPTEASMADRIAQIEIALQKSMKARDEVPVHRVVP